MNTRLRTMSRAGGYRLVGPQILPLTEHLVTVFRIQPGMDLAWLTAPEAPACNHAALRHWVRIQLAGMASQPVDNLLITLEERLHRLWLEAFPDQGRGLALPSRRARRSHHPMPFWQRTSECLPRGRSRALQQAQGTGIPARNVNHASRKEDSA
jgi:hypothetical protein